MNSPIRAKALPFAIATLLAVGAAPAIAQNVTSSAVTGQVVDASGQPVADATVQIVHEPSGTTKVVTTDAAGRYTAQGLRVGGPFDITATKSGMAQGEQDDVYLQLGQTSAVNLTMAAVEAQNLSGVTVTASALMTTFSPDNKGTGTNVSHRELVATPSPSRSITDIARLDPRVSITDPGDSSISMMGMNSRYNSISVDGVGQGDPFGLNSNGLPYVGSPISVDTIEEYNISTANYDVTSDAVGASIDAVTKSGTNDFHGSVYYAYRNADKLVGELDDEPYNGYKRDWTAGATLGGPIVKDKLFFFVNYEQEKTIGLGADSANGLDTSLGNGPSTDNKVSPGDLQRIINAANALGLTPGTFSGGNVDLEDKRYLAKIDWNISNNHRASLTYQSTKETQPIVQGNSSSAIGLTSYWYTKNSDTKNTVLHFFDDWTENFSTEAKIGYQRFQQERSVNTQQPQVYVDVTRFDNDDGTQSGGRPYVDLGEDQYSHYNVLDVKTWRGFLAGTYYLADHTLKGGVDFQQNEIYNLFGRTQFGAYTFYGIDNFEQGIYGEYNLYQPAPGYTLDDVAAQWTMRQYAFFLQDTWQASDNLSLQYGVRVNLAKTNDKPVYNPAFEEAFGYRNDATIDGMRVVEPRLSFNYSFDTERMTQLRGGVGLFQSNPPTVWATNPYQNNGMTTATYQVFNDEGLVPGAGNTLPVFSADPFNQNLPPPAGAQMNVDTIDPNFKLPSVWKFSLALDRELPWWGIVGSAEYQHIDVRNGILYQNINIGTPTGLLPDGRNQYWATPGEESNSRDARANANDDFSGSSTYLTNTHKGHADSLTLSLKKPFSESWFGSVGVTLGHSTEVNPGTSSQASSNFKNNVWVNPNEDVASTSNYNVGRRVTAALTWQHRFFGNYATSVSAFYDGHNGQPYSWTFGNDANGDSYASDLVYIPAVNDTNVTFAEGTDPAVIQQFYDFIQNDSYLSDHQGEIAKRNGTRSAWVNQVDLSFRQEIPGIFEGNKGEIRLDIYNFLNMLNNDWGQVSYIGFPYTRDLADYAGVDAQGRYIYDLPTDEDGNYQPEQKIIYDAGRNTKTSVVSRWSAMLTVRYSF
ncbi:TonB-dependent receptor [Frateuria hangzhouensis]|uniref:TonB-dependent receptor n=1 Tax=Frateuria hangzhouensis TaxID=2995589 RepID=UPI002260DFDC|nr:TonB-dependent receptor [Frateuria sp. STR12]MCX7513704.1 TonB-dependent receptor [Frateuria sp. STR12]